MRKLCLITAFLAVCTFVFAQEKINLSDEIPFDETYRTGTLENGMKYYIKHNEKPEKRAEFWLIVHAGAMQEDADQNGLAHYCEHMAFNGTKNFPDKGVLDYLQSIGMEFGPDINAWTSYNETVYTLTKVPVEDKAYIDTSLLILRDWASDVSYLDEEIEKERGVIHEEWRVRNSSYSRIRDSINMKLFQGSKYAEHNVIGDIDIVDNVAPQRLRDFFNTWYRPDLQAIVAIGDIDLDETERKIIEVFGTLEKSDTPKPRQLQEIPDHDETLYAMHTDKEASNVQMQMYFKHDPLPKLETFADLREMAIRQLALEIVGQRVEERNLNEGQPMTYGGWGFYNIMPEKSALMFYSYPREDQILLAAEILLEEMNRAVQTGLTEEELDLVKESNLRWVESSVTEKDTEESRYHCYDVVNAFKKNEAIMSPETLKAFYEQYIMDISLKEVNQSLQGLMSEGNRVFTLSGPETLELPNEKTVADLIDRLENKKYEAYDPIENIADLMPVSPKAGSIESIVKMKNPEYEKWTLSNGMTLFVKFADFKKDEYSFYLYSEGGQSLYEAADRAKLQVAKGAVTESGLAEFTKVQVDRYMDGKKMYDYGGINIYSEYISGLAKVKYLEDNFKMYHLMMSQPILNKKGFDKFMSTRETFYKNRLNNPNSVMNDSVSDIRYAYHPWAKSLSWEDYESVEYSTELLDLYKERYSDASDFVLFLVGNFKEKDLKVLVETYLASLPGTGVKEEMKDVGRYMVKEAIQKEIEIPMVTPKAKVQLEYHNMIEYTAENLVLMKAVSNILDRRFTETVREDEGGTYGVSTYGYITKRPIEESNYTVSFTCDPERAEELKAVVYSEIDKLLSGDVEDHYVEEFRKAYNKKRSESLKENFTWINMMYMHNFYGMYEYSDAMNALVETVSKEEIVAFAQLIFREEVKMDVTFMPAESKQ